MKRLLALIICIPLFTAAQNKALMIEGAAPNLYLNHTVAAKENYYSIGRMYNISPKEIAPFNNLEMEKGLSLGHAVKIPLTANNFIQSNNAGADEVLVPVYYAVKEKEGLYRVSTSFNKVPVEILKQWNNIKGDAVSNGTKLIVGYLKVKKDLSPLSGMAKPVAMPVVTKEKTTPPKPEVKKETPAVVKSEEKEKPEEPKQVKETAKPDTDKKDVAEVKKAEETVVIKPAARNFDGGYFKTEYEKQSHKTSKENGTAGVFKSTSGWQDGKYYCLHNTAAPRTFVKITNPATGKAVYAKVLDTIPDIGQNNGLVIVLSNAAAAELGTGETKFDCTVNFSK
jgi:LysM repeat protein